MCGILCVLGTIHIVDIMIDGLNALKNRGYDSCGICYIEENEFQCLKYISSNCIKKIEKELRNRTVQSSLAIGHTRWATHGHVTEKNAHPHFDNKSNISIVHNGIIENATELKNELQKLNYFFYSETDTEVIAVLVGYYIDQGLQIKQAIENTIDRLRGTWAIIFIHRLYIDICWIARNGSPLIIGIDKDFVLIASEKTALGCYINNYIVLEDHNVLEIKKDNSGNIQYSQNMQQYSTRNYNNDSFNTILSTDYEHWILKEIHEQPQCIMRSLNNGGRILNSENVKLGGLEVFSCELQRLQHIVLLGCGTSYNAALWSSHIFKQLGFFNTVQVYDAGEFSSKDLPLKGACGVIFITQSGETKDLHRCVQIVKERNMITIGVTNVVDSMIARETDCGVYLNCGQETSVASTKSFTNQCIVLSLIAVWFSQCVCAQTEKRRVIISDILKLSFQMNILLQTITEEFLTSYTNQLKNATTIFVLGKGKSFPIALEGALKLKELTYIHTEGFSSSALKHGPLSLIDFDTPIIMLDIDNEHHSSNWNCYEEVVARGASVIYISNDPIQKLEHITIDRNTTYSGLLGNVVLQLMSYYIARARGNDIDCPRNLAKVVTVY